MPDIEKYIRKQRKAGYSDDEIIDALSSSGWSEEEIYEALGESRNNTALYITIALVVISGLVAYKVWDAYSNAPYELGASGLEVCEDLGCLSQNALNCTPSETMQVQYDEALNKRFDSEYLYRISPVEEGCQVYMEIVEVNVSYTEEQLQNFREQGASEEEIREIDENVQDRMSYPFGEVGYCTYSNEDLSYILEKWNEGDLDMKVNCTKVPRGEKCPYFGDFENATCTGSWFVQ